MEQHFIAALVLVSVLVGVPIPALLSQETSDANLIISKILNSDLTLSVDAFM